MTDWRDETLDCTYFCTSVGLSHGLHLSGRFRVYIGRAPWYAMGATTAGAVTTTISAICKRLEQRMCTSKLAHSCKNEGTIVDVDISLGLMFPWCILGSNCN